MLGASSVDAMIVAPLWCLVQTGTIGGRVIMLVIIASHLLLCSRPIWALVDFFFEPRVNPISITKITEMQCSE
jgi:hypothetical protein